MFWNGEGRMKKTNEQEKAQTQDVGTLMSW